MGGDDVTDFYAAGSDDIICFAYSYDRTNSCLLYTSLAVIKRMVRDLNFNLEVVGCPIVREKDGLAKSSRNTYLNAEERQAALVLPKAVKLGQEIAEAGERDANKIVASMKACIEAEPLAKIDYVKAVDAVSIEIVSAMKPPVLVAMAVYIGKTRPVSYTHLDVYKRQSLPRRRPATIPSVTCIWRQTVRRK